MIYVNSANPGKVFQSYIRKWTLLGGFIVYLTQGKVIWKEETSVQKITSSVGTPTGHFLNKWCVRTEAHCRKATLLFLIDDWCVSTHTNMGNSVVNFSAWKLMWEGEANCNGTTPGMVILGSIVKQAEQTMGNKQVSCSILHGLCFSPFL